MATKKTITSNEEEVKNVKKTNSTENTVSKEEYDKLKAQVELMTQMFVSLQKEKTPNVVLPEMSSKENSLTEEVKIVHLIERGNGLTTSLKLSNLEINMSRFGEERTLDKRQAEEAVGKYRVWFEKGIIAFAAGSEKFAAKNNVKCITDYKYMDKDFVEKIASLNAVELEKLYEQLAEGHKAFIIEMFKKKNIDGKDPRFLDAQKIEMLNRVSNGAMDGLLLDRRTSQEKVLINK